ncbi:MAG TPA: response regulator transcription factor [Verrucomicrobiae bacterium]|nr:response regulator transcription factor [Verrucomicrobiae bacterium]
MKKKAAGDPIRVLCIDDHLEIRRLFELVLKDEKGIEIVAMADSAEKLEEHIETHAPEVVVLDISMPGRNPVEAMRETKRRHPGVRFLISSSYDDPGMIQRVFDAGANGYLVKGSAFEDLADSIRRVTLDEKVMPRKLPQV